MADDLPEISQDLDTPLPTVAPDSALVPYRIARTDPGAQPVVSTGWSHRARPPIQPPAGFGGGVGMPNLDQIYQAAFSKLPVGEAVQAYNAASKYIGQKMLSQALANAKTPEEYNAAYGQYGWMALGNGAGVPELIRANSPTIHTAGTEGLYRVPARGPAQQLVAPKPATPTTHVNNTTGEIIQVFPDGTKRVVQKATRSPKPEPMEPEDRMEVSAAHTRYNEAYRDMAKLIATPLPKNATAKQKKDYQDKQDDARDRMRDSQAIIAKFNPQVQTQQPAEAPNVKEVIRMTRDGKKAVFDADTKKFIRYAE